MADDVDPKVIQLLVPGPQGAPGAIIRGDYDPTVQYEPRDGVSFGGSSYYTLTPVIGVAPPASPWKALASKGDQGPQGTQGPKGDKGDQGDEGPQGADGAQGVAGPQGAKGDKGDKGDAGADGADGAAGAQGPKGDKGDTGDVGADGAQGAAGPQGLKGDKGDKGDTGADGAQGVAGPQGLKGDKGDKGDAGADGAQGVAGPQGVKGDKGDTGAAGTDGADGAAGPQGLKGDKGDKGDTGADGAQGVAGPQGIAGSVGPQGPEGPQGLQGATGAAGPQGSVGPQGPTGPQGASGGTLVPRNAYDNSFNYAAGDLTTYNGSAYYLPTGYVGTITGVVPPTAPWLLFTDVTTAANSAQTAANTSATNAANSASAASNSAAAAATAMSSLSTTVNQYLGRPNGVNPVAGTGTATSSNIFVFADPVTNTGPLASITGYFTAGTVTVKKFSKSGTTFTQTGTVTFTVSSTGLQTVLAAAMSATLTLNAGEYLGVGGGQFTYNSGAADGAGWYQWGTSSSSATNPTLVSGGGPTLQLSCLIAAQIQTVTATTFGALQTSVNSNTTSISALNTSVSANALAVAALNTTLTDTLARPVDPITGTGIGTNAYVVQQAVPHTGTLQSLKIFALTTGTVTIWRYTLSGSTLTIQAIATFSAVAGLHTYTQSDWVTLFGVNAGDYLGISGAGIVTFTANASDGTGFWGTTTSVGVGSTAATGGSFTTQRIEVQYNIAYQSQVVTASSFGTVQSAANTASTNAASALSAATGVKTNLSQTVTSVIGRPTSATLATGSAISTQMYIDATPIPYAGTMTEYDLFAMATGTLTIATFSLSGGTLTRTGLTTVTISATGLQTVNPNLAVNAGDMIGIAGSGVGAYKNLAADGPGYYFSGLSGGAVPTLQTGYQFQQRFTIVGNVQTVTASAFSTTQSQVSGLLATVGASTLTLANVDKIVLTSNSYGESAMTILGKSSSQIASALSEYNWGNFSQGGQTPLQIAGLIAGGTQRYGATFAGLKPKYAILSENQNGKNGGTTDAVYYAGTQAAVDTIRDQGATPVISSEWASDSTGGSGYVAFPGLTTDGEQRNVRGLRALANANDLLFFDVTSPSRWMTPKLYANFMKSQHPATRLIYSEINGFLAGLKQMPRPLRSMKIFRVRGTVSVSGPSSLVFRTVADRHRLFRELYLGQSCLGTSEYINYDQATNLYVNSSSQNDEYVALAAGTATSLGTYTLIDCVLPVTNPTGVTLTVSDTTVTAYARQMTNTGIAWVQLTLTNGAFVVPDGQGLADRDRVSFLIYKAAGISLNASPSVSWTGGTARQLATPPRLYPPRGTELLAQPLTVVSSAVASQWTNTGSLTVSSGRDGVYPGGTTGGVDVTSSAGLSQTFTYPSSIDPVEVVIRVLARRWVPVFQPNIIAATTASGSPNLTSVSTTSGAPAVGDVITGPGVPNGSTLTAYSPPTATISQNATAAAAVSLSSASSSLIASAPITTETCDTATLQVTLSGASGIGNASAVMTDQVGLHWWPIEFRETLEANPTGTTTVAIDVRSQDYNIEIAEVSVRPLFA